MRRYDKTPELPPRLKAVQALGWGASLGPAGRAGAPRSTSAPPTPFPTLPAPTSVLHFVSPGFSSPLSFRVSSPTSNPACCCRPLCRRFGQRHRRLLSLAELRRAPAGTGCDRRGAAHGFLPPRCPAGPGRPRRPSRGCAASAAGAEAAAGFQAMCGPSGARRLFPEDCEDSLEVYFRPPACASSISYPPLSVPLVENAGLRHRFLCCFLPYCSVCIV